MVIKKANEFSRFEWTKSISTSIGDIDSWSMAGKLQTKDDIDRYVNKIFNRLVTCTEYGKVYGYMMGEPAYSGTRIHHMADNKYVNRVRNKDVKQVLNKFVINGIMFILMTQAEYEVYSKMSYSAVIARGHASFRKYLMSHPKTKEANERVEKERLEAEKQWKAGREDNEFGIDMAYHGPEWDYFFTEVFPTWENKFAADSIAQWADSVGYYAFSEGDAVKKVRILVGDLWSEYKKWCVAARFVPLYVKQFSVRMAELGFLKRSGGGRSFDVFIGSAADTEKWEQAKAEREAAVREKMLARIEERKIARDDTEFLDGLIGRFQAAELWSRYEEFCRACGKQLGFGKRQFYKWLDDNGFSRETKSGCLFMEKK